ncbi:hypothetical protein H8959_008508 [Pygathrix nigripes]
MNSSLTAQSRGSDAELGPWVMAARSKDAAPSQRDGLLPVKVEEDSPGEKYVTAGGLESRAENKELIPMQEILEAEPQGRLQEAFQGKRPLLSKCGSTHEDSVEKQSRNPFPLKLENSPEAQGRNSISDVNKNGSIEGEESKNNDLHNSARRSNLVLCQHIPKAERPTDGHKVQTQSDDAHRRWDPASPRFPPASSRGLPDSSVRILGSGGSCVPASVQCRRGEKTGSQVPPATPDFRSSPARPTKQRPPRLPLPQPWSPSAPGGCLFPDTVQSGLFGPS